jgi:hypothetical protein
MSGSQGSPRELSGGGPGRAPLDGSGDGFPGRGDPGRGEAVVTAPGRSFGVHVDVLLSAVEPSDRLEGDQDGVDRARFESCLVGEVKAVSFLVGAVQQRLEYQELPCPCSIQLLIVLHRGSFVRRLTQAHRLKLLVYTGS